MTTQVLYAIVVILFGLGAFFVAWGIIKLHNGG